MARSREYDNEIRDEILNRIYVDLGVESYNIVVNVREGRAILSGYVPSERTKLLALDDTNEVFGVDSIKDDLMILSRD